MNEHMLKTDVCTVEWSTDACPLQWPAGLIGEAGKRKQAPSGTAVGGLQLLVPGLGACHGAAPRHSHLTAATRPWQGFRDVGKHAVRVPQQPANGRCVCITAPIKNGTSFITSYNANKLLYA